MPPSADNSGPYNNSSSNLNFLYQRHRSRLQGFENLPSRPLPLSSHELSRREAYGDRLNRLYPRELTKPTAGLRPAQSPHAITSPLLSALGSTTNTAAQYTSDWAKSLPFFPGPQPNSHSGSPTPQLNIPNGRDGVAGPIANSHSPPNLRPQSHPNQYPSFGGRQAQSPRHRDRRASMFAQYGHGGPFSGHVPLPHEDQAHFHPGGLPDLDSFGIPPVVNGLSPGEKGYYCGFDTLSTAGHQPSVSSENVLVVGFEGGLRIYRVSRKSVEVIGRLEGLQGAVVGAKILPWTFQSDPGSSGRPYIAFILHGPVIDGSEGHDSSNSSAVASVDDQENSPEPSARSAPGQPTEMSDVVKHYQTTVEVYSLSTRAHVATLFRSPVVEVEYPLIGEYKIPPPVGDLRIDANGKFVVVASGVSGEVFIFSPYTKKRNSKKKKKKMENFRCVGKLWTSVQRRESKPMSSTSSNGEPMTPPDEAEAQRGTPLFALSQRWIATVPPPSTSLFSLKGVALLQNDARPPGITTHMAPPQPITNCAIDTPDNEGFMNRMSREVAQGVLKGAKWMGEQGMQAWNNYWNKPMPPGFHANGPYVADPQAHMFPPTHGYNGPTTPASSDPAQVAIFDLQRLLDAEEIKVKNALVPLATFEPPSGCSYLSFVPSGLALLTVSRKGDQQVLWSLMRMQHPRSGSTLNPNPGPYVRQMARFTRMTVARVVDVVWIAPQGNRFAMITERGTIHVHEIPASAFLWPPLRRARRLKDIQRLLMLQDDKDKADASSMKGPISTAMEHINASSAWLRSVRSKGGANMANLIMTPAATANVGGKAVKAGFSKGIGLVANSANTIYHASDNKLNLGCLVNGVNPGCMRWMTGKDRGYLAIVVAGTLSIYPVKQTTVARKGHPPLIGAKISKRPIEFMLHKIPDDQFAPAFRAAIEARYGTSSPKDAEGGGGATDTVTGVWSLRAPSGAGTPAAAAAAIATTAGGNGNQKRRVENWHTLVEAETNPPYQPFHTDRRITLCAYPEPELSKSPNDKANEHDEDHEQEDTVTPWLQDIHHVNPDSVDVSEAWVFGEEIPVTKILVGGTGNADGFSDDDDDDTVENRIRVIEGEGGEQVVVTTVRRKGREEEDFFEDGCEVLDFAEDRV